MIDEKDRSKSLAYYYANKPRILKRQKIYKRQHLLRFHNYDIRGLNKSPFPEGGVCPFCGGSNRKLQWHHWLDTNLNDGLWMCTKCHFILENLFRQMPLKADELRKGLKIGFTANHF